MKTTYIFFILINLTLSINASCLVEEQSGIEGKTESAGLATFNVYELIDDIAKSQGQSYEAYTDSANHPGIENTKNLMIELINLIKQKKEDELAFLQDLRAKIEALPETATAEEYGKIHPWFIIPAELTTKELRGRFLQMTTGASTVSHIGTLDWALEKISYDKFGEFFSYSIDQIYEYLYIRWTNKQKYRLPSTSQQSITSLQNSGRYWDANAAETAVSIMALRIDLLRLITRFIPTYYVTDECTYKLYTTGLGKIIFTNERENNPIDPDSLMDKLIEITGKEAEKEAEKFSKTRMSDAIEFELNKQDPVPKKFKNFLSDIIQKIDAGQIAMPKPFGTSARLVAEQEARKKAAKKQLEEEKKATQRKKEERKRIRNTVAKLSRNAGKKAAAFPQSEEITEVGNLIETFNAESISSEAPATSATVDIPSEAPTTAIFSNLDDHSAKASEEFFVPSAAVDDSEFADIDNFTFFQKASVAKKDVASSLKIGADEVHKELRWVKHATEDRYVPSCKINLTSGQRRVLDDIRKGAKFSFTMDNFSNFMKGLGITEQSRKGSHARFSTPGRLPKIFVNPHCGWTNRFGPGAMKSMLDLVNSLSLGADSEYVI